MPNSIIVPSSPADLKKLKDGIKEMTDSMTRVDGEKDHQKDIIEDLSEQFGIEKKFIRRMANDDHRDTYEKKADEMEEYGALYEAVRSAT